MTTTSKIRAARAVLAVAGCAGLAAIPVSASARGGAEAPTFTNPTRIDNPYLPLSRFSRCTLRGHEGNQRLRIKRQVLDRTRTFIVAGAAVEAMVVRDR